MDEWEICDFAGMEAGKATRQGDVHLRLRLPGFCQVKEVVVRDVLHVAGAHNALSQSRLMDRGLWIVTMNGYGIKIYDIRGQGSHVAVSPQVEGLFLFDMDVATKGCQWSDVSRDKLYTAPNAILNEHTYMCILEQEELKTQEILIPIASTPMINRPLAVADNSSKGHDSGGNSNGGNSSGISGGQMKDHLGCSDENDTSEGGDEDEDNSPLVIDKSKQSSFTRELAGLSRNLGSGWKAPAGSHRR